MCASEFWASDLNVNDRKVLPILIAFLTIKLKIELKGCKRIQLHLTSIQVEVDTNQAKDDEKDLSNT